MKKGNISDNINPSALAESGTESNKKLSGDIDISAMPRLTDIVERVEGVVVFTLNVDKDKQGFPFLKGDVKTKLWLSCQRCLQPFLYKVEKKFSLCPIRADSEVNDIPQGYEPLLTEEGVVSLTTMLEDEVLLALPLVARHKEEECSVKLDIAKDEVKTKNKDKISPFAKLVELKKKK